MSTQKHTLHPSQETLLAYVRGELTPRAEHGVERHALDCRDCDDIITGLMQLREQGLLESSIEAIPASFPRETPVRPISRRYWWAAAAVLALGTMIWVSSLLLPAGLDNAPLAVQPPSVNVPPKESVSEKPASNTPTPPAKNQAAPVLVEKEQLREEKVLLQENKNLVLPEKDKAPVLEPIERKLIAVETEDLQAEGATIITAAPTSAPLKGDTATVMAYNWDFGDSGLLVKTQPAYTNNAPLQTLSIEETTVKTLSANSIVFQSKKLPQVQQKKEQLQRRSYKSRADNFVADSTLEASYLNRLKIDPQHYPSLLGEAELLYKQGKYEAALGYYRSAMNSPTALDKDYLKLAQARCLLQLKRKEEARTLLNQLESSKYAKEAKELLKQL